MNEPEYDVVLFGATGFTGALTADYLGRAAGPQTRWAIAGRNPAKLEATRERLGDPDLALLTADVSDPESLRRMAESAKVVITTVGPYIHYGEPLVAACAAAGTDYVDLTGEPEFVDLMWLRYHAQAQRTGARLVHSCGFDSIPYDLGALYIVNQLPEGVSLKLEGFVRAGGTFSGGTYHSAVHIMGRLRQSRQVAAQRKRLESRPDGRRITGVTALPHHDDTAGGWVLPAPTIDPQVVLRSARALERYGPEFSYGHYIVNKRLAKLGGAGGRRRDAGRPVPAATDPEPAAQVPRPGRRPRPRAAGEGVVQRPLQGRGGRGRAGRHRGQRRRPRLRRDLEDAGRVGALPGPRRSPRARRPADSGGGHGAGADRPPHRRRDRLYHASGSRRRPR